MAVARCEACGQPQGMKQDYPHPHATTEATTGNQRILCGATSCSRVAVVWLTDAEEEEYVVACDPSEFYSTNTCRWGDRQQGSTPMLGYVFVEQSPCFFKIEPELLHTFA